jgi:hypothetical protein
VIRAALVGVLVGLCIANYAQRKRAEEYLSAALTSLQDSEASANRLAGALRGCETELDRKDALGR